MVDKTQLRTSLSTCQVVVVAIPTDGTTATAIPTDELADLLDLGWVKIGAWTDGDPSKIVRLTPEGLRVAKSLV